MAQTTANQTTLQAVSERALQYCPVNYKFPKHPFGKNKCLYHGPAKLFDFKHGRGFTMNSHQVILFFATYARRPSRKGGWKKAEEIQHL